LQCQPAEAEGKIGSELCGVTIQTIFFTVTKTENLKPSKNFINVILHCLHYTYKTAETQINALPKEHTLHMRVSISFVSNIYPKGIQFRNLSSVSSVDPTSGAFCELSFKKSQRKCFISITFTLNMHKTAIHQQTELLQAL
jgi:hypothetical protein